MKQTSPSIHGNESGQATLEYILLLVIVVGAYATLAGFIGSSGLSSKLTSAITTDFAHAYQYGRPDALGFTDGGPKNHPRAVENGNIRLFINPQSKN